MKDPFFIPAALSYRPKGDLLLDILCGPEIDPAIEPLHDICQMRNLHQARLLAQYLIDGSGNWKKGEIERAFLLMKEHLYVIGPHRFDERDMRLHLLHCLQALMQEDLQRMVMRFYKPHAFALAEQIIRSTLLISRKEAISDSHARQAALSAFFCYLRQSVGSCFATAPACILQRQVPHAFFKDLQEMLSLGYLRRVIDGVEHTAPLSFSAGSGSYRRPFILSNLSILASSVAFLGALQSMGIPFVAQNYEKYVGKNVTCEMLLRASLLRHWNIGEKQMALMKSRHLLPAPKKELLLIKKEEPNGSYEHFQQLLKGAKETFCSWEENALLKSWEFTLASLSEAKSHFVKWNLYHSLGLDPQQEGGIGQSLQMSVQQSIAKFQTRIEELNVVCERLYFDLKSLQGMAQIADSEARMRWLQNDYRLRRQEYEQFLQEREEAVQKAQSLPPLLAYVIEKYIHLFPIYFQEVYDPEMTQISHELFEDAPAGFRLLYKHGREHPSSWSLIYGPKEFLEFLNNFFSLTESELLLGQEAQGVEKELEEAITSVCLHLQTPQFLESAFLRVAHFHNISLPKNFMQDWEQIPKKPWEYTSGGSMSELLQTYFLLKKQPAQESRWVESPVELASFLIDVLRLLPTKEATKLKNAATCSMLMNSPTHAFLLQPGRLPFQKSWYEETIFAYSWVRDNYILPCRQYLQKNPLSRSQALFLLRKWSSALPKERQKQASLLQKNLPEMISSVELTDILQDSWRWFKNWLPLWEGFLYSHYPMMQSDKVLDALDQIFARSALFPDAFSWQKDLPDIPEYVSPPELLHIALHYWVKGSQTATSPSDVAGQIVQAMQDLDMAYPAPLIFADTNWPGKYFAFVVSLASGDLMLWHMDAYGLHGMPMDCWQSHLDGSSKLSWTVYSRPHQYSI